MLGKLASDSSEFTLDYVRQPEDLPERLPADATAEQKAAASAKWRDEKLTPALEKLSPASLQNYDGVIFASTTGDLPIPDREGLLSLGSIPPEIPCTAGPPTTRCWAASF